MYRVLFAAAVTTLLAATPVGATTPVLSGKYLGRITIICQPSLSITYSNGTVTSIGIASAGSTTDGAITANFDPSTQSVSLKGFDNAGSTLLATDNLGHSYGAGFTAQSQNVNYPYSNTGTTVTINGTVFKTVYGPLKSGVAQSLVAEAIDGAGCSDSA